MNATPVNASVRSCLSVFRTSDSNVKASVALSLTFF